MIRPIESRLPSSFRDPSGFLFQRDGILFRQINQVYRDDFDHLMRPGGLYECLVNDNLLIRHADAPDNFLDARHGFKVIAPERLAFISYPYEWCFSQLKDAALLTLRIQLRALERNMSLKDCSAYNIQFRRGQPVLIDTLSFGRYEESTPWVAYRQFCQHFLAPLALMSHLDVRLSQLSRVHIDGVPLDLASALLPIRTRLNYSLVAHLHVHARYQKRHADDAATGAAKVQNATLSKFQLTALVHSLQSAVRKLTWTPSNTEWGDYYEDTNYDERAMEKKRTLVARLVSRVQPSSIWDLGANNGRFSRVAADALGCQVISFDIDPVAVEKNYRQCKKEQRKDILPLVLDLTNPSPALGWHHRERDSVMARGPADLAMGLALIHHLAISNNLPFDHLAMFFRDVGKTVILEFIPKNDSQVRRLLATREDVFPDYHEQAFEASVEKHFEITERVPIEGSQRTLYLLTRRHDGPTPG
jgi:ribosomal protein L11 methylase PrmA